AGGGGRGMRKAESARDLQRLWEQSRNEAKASFGDDGLYLERNLEGVRHIEAQILVDDRGEAIFVGERECSIQRRNQKMLEEAPSISINEELRRRIKTYAVDAAKRFGYRGVGTFELLVDAVDRRPHHVASTGRAGDPARLALLPGLRGPAVLRLAAREGDRVGEGPHRGGGADAACARRVHRRRRDDEHRRAQEDPRVGGVQ